MEDINRRVALTLGLAAAPGLVFGASAEEASPAQAPYAPDFGKEIAPGVRQVDFHGAYRGASASNLPGYKSVSMRDLVFQPGATTFDAMARNDMIGHVTHGLIRVNVNEREWFDAKGSEPWTVPKGVKTIFRNTGADVAVVRIIDLLN